jgi:DNA-binding HxlR family transcriptional regulator
MPRPVHDFLDLLGRRWALRVVWELRRDALPFSALRERLAVSPSVLATRLEELGGAGILERDASRRYVLSGSGRELARLLYEMNRWAEGNKLGASASESGRRLSSQG